MHRHHSPVPHELPAPTDPRAPASHGDPSTPTSSAAARSRLRLYISRLPGLAVCAAATAAAYLLSLVIPYVGPVLIAIVLGVVARNLLPAIPAVMTPGIDFTSKTLLRLGIVLLGFRLVLGDIVGLGWGAIAIIVAVVAVGFAGAQVLGRWLGVSRDLSLLIGAGFSICGAAAVAGAESTIRAKKEDTAAAVALVVLFGTAMIVVVPTVAGLLGLSQHAAGMWAGASTHEVAQVAAIGGILGTEALKVATLVKLGRVVLLAPLMLVLGVIIARADRRKQGAVPTASTAADRAGKAAQTGEVAPAGEAARTFAGPAPAAPVAPASGASHAAKPAVSESPAPKRPPLIPAWVLGFIVAAVIATVFALPHWFTATATLGQSLLLTAAMFGLGTGVHIKSLLRLGPKPVLLAFLTTCLVAGVAALGIWLLV